MFLALVFAVVVLVATSHAYINDPDFHRLVLRKVCPNNHYKGKPCLDLKYAQSGIPTKEEYVEIDSRFKKLEKWKSDPLFYQIRMTDQARVFCCRNELCRATCEGEQELYDVMKHFPQNFGLIYSVAPELFEEIPKKDVESLKNHKVRELSEKSFRQVLEIVFQNTDIISNLLENLVEQRDAQL